MSVYWTCLRETLLRIFPCEPSLAEVDAWQTLCCSASLLLVFSASISLSLPSSLSVCLLVWQQANTGHFTDYFHEVPPSTLQNQPVMSQSPQRDHQNPFWCCEERMGMCVCVCPSPLSLPLFFPTELVPAICVCWLTGPKGETIVLYLPRDPPLPSLRWNPFYSANSSRSGI